MRYFFKIIFCIFSLFSSMLYSQTPLFSDVAVSDSGSANSIGEANTSRNIDVDEQGNIYVVYANNTQIRLAKSINGGQSFLPSVLIANTTGSFVEPELAVNYLGYIFVTWINVSGSLLFTSSTDGGVSFSTPSNLGFGNSGSVHMSTYNDAVYITNRPGTTLYYNLNNGVGVFNTVSSGGTYVYADVLINQNGIVYLSADDPFLYLYESLDGGATLNELTIDPLGEVYFSSYALSDGPCGNYLFVAGGSEITEDSGTVGYKIDVTTGASTQITFGDNSASETGRTLYADNVGTVIDGYKDSSGQLLINYSYDQGDTFNTPIVVAQGNSHNLGRNPLTDDVLVVYSSNGSIYLTVYNDLLKSVKIPEPDPVLAFCVGDSFDLDFTLSGLFDPNSSFVAILSDEFGSFDNGVEIGTLVTDQSGAISCTLAGDLVSSSEYRILIQSLENCLQSNAINVIIGFGDSIEGPSSVCLGETIQLSSDESPNANTPWESSNTEVATISSNGVLTPNSVGETTINFTNSDGCVSSKEITVNSMPQVPTLEASDDICSGEDVVFTITGTAGDIVSYILNEDGITLQLTLDEDGQGLVFISGATENQSIALSLVESPVTSCDTILTNTDSVEVASPTVSLVTNNSICEGEDAIFTITGEAGYIVDYELNGEGVSQITLDDSGVAIIVVSEPTSSQSISLTSFSSSMANCSGELDITGNVIVNSMPTISSLTSNAFVCSGGTAVFTIIGTANDVVSFTINEGVSQEQIIDDSGELIVNVLDVTVNQVILLSSVSTPSTNCSMDLTDSISVEIIDNPTAAIETNSSICEGEDALFTIEGTSGDTITYSINEGESIQFMLDDTGIEEITVSEVTLDQIIEFTVSNSTMCTSELINATILVNPLPTIVNPTDLEVCDQGTSDGIVEMDLTVKNEEITGGNPSYSVTYYEGLDVNGDLDPATEITTPEAYTNTNPYTQTLYVLVTDVNTTCTDTTTLDIVVEQAPEAFAPDALEYCDPDNDCFGVFNLTDAELQITGGVSGLDVTFHETAIDAENNVNALSSPYNNIVACEQTVYVRVESATIATDCASFEELVLIVHPTPAIVDPTPFEICDDDTADGFATFDLRTKEAEILNGLDSALYTITYYLEEADANVPQNQIGSPSAFQNTDPYNQTVWVRVEDNTTGCFKVTSLELVVNALPVLVQPDPLTLCDYNNPGDEIEVFTLEDANAQILNGQTGITLTYYDTQANAEIGDGTGQLFSPYINSMNPETIYVRGENDVTGCWDFVILDLRVSPLPSPATPADYEVCDDDNDGFAEFDLSSQSTAIENGEPDITITYHETEADANSGENALPNNYINSVPNTQVIYVRAENTGATPGTGTGCYTIVELTLIVLPAPVIPVTLPDYVICDEDTDGYAQFDFDTVMDPQIYGSQDPADFILSYHTTQAAAETGNNPITNTSNYTNQTQWTEDIYIHLESIANGCVTTRMFTIRVVTAPEVNPNYDHTLTSCDNLDENYQEINDGFTSFNLTSENLEITNGEASWSVTYYETQADAEAGINAIDPATDYTNIEQGVQTIIAEVTDTDTGCSSFTTVTLQVLPNPSPSPDPENLELCDDNNSGDMIEIFDLTENEAYILNNEDGVTLSYYTSQDDAVMGTNAIADPTQHSNEDPDNLGTGITPQTIYVRVENTGTTGVPATGCYSLVNFDVIVNPLPVVPDSIEGLLHCEINNDGIYDDFGFDLESQTDLILNGQDATIFTVTYHENQMDADTGANALLSPYENIMNPQIIYVNVTNTETGCTIGTLNFTIEVQEGALANQNLATYEICDDNMEFDGDTANDMAEFDLSTQNALALDGQDPNNYTVSYYASQADADAGINSLPLLYTNSINPQTIIVRVDNDTPGPIIGLDLSMVAPPGLDFNNDGIYDTYDTDNDNIFDFINVNVDENDDNVSDGFDYDNDGFIDAIDIDDDNIGDLVYINGEIVNDTSICYETAELILQVHPMPAFNLEDSYILCVNVNGTEVINVPVIATGLNASDYSFEWSIGGVVIPGETGPSITPTQGGEYSVVVTDVVTGCSTDPTDPNTITQVNESQPPTIHVEQSTLAFADQHTISVQVTNITPGNIGVYEFNIDGSEWVSNTPNDAMYLFENVEAGEHTIKARDINGCGETTEIITIMDYPHYFTPNGDGYNDTWNIYGLSNQLDAKIYIFDRFGKLIKQISPASAGWNGTYRGNLMPTSDYWFTVEYREPNTTDAIRKTFRAHFTLKR